MHSPQSAETPRNTNFRCPFIFYFLSFLGMLLWESTPAKWKTKIQIQYQLKIKKPKPKFLSEQEYIDQNQVETTRALKELRDYCKSPKCDAWKMTSRLTSPSRFAEFVAGTRSPVPMKLQDAFD
jgi:hypothetical protein